MRRIRLNVFFQNGPNKTGTIGNVNFTGRDWPKSYLLNKRLPLSVYRVHEKKNKIFSNIKVVYDNITIIKPMVFGFRFYCQNFFYFFTP